MARTRQEIIDELFEQAESDPILSSVSRSLVGKELTYFGGNVLYQAEMMQDAISRFSDISRADFQQLIAFAYTNDVPCDTVKPAMVRLEMKLNEVKVFPPFSIRLEVGSLQFYNIDFVKSDSQVTLYQGKPMAMTSKPISNDGAKLDVFGLDSSGILSDAGSYKTWKLYKEFKQGKYQSSYVKLGEGVISDSVRVFARQLGTSGVDVDQIVFPYTEFNQGLSSPDAKLYKVRTGWDKSINVLFGDDNWAMMVNQDQFQYELYWLQAGTSNYNLKTSNPLFLGYDGSKSILRDSSKSEFYTVNSYSLAERDSLPYAKSYVQTKKFLQQGLVTEKQIVSYVDSIPSVNSSRVSSDQQTNSVTVVVKPSDPEDTNFEFLEDILLQSGVIGQSYSVVVATPLDFNVEVTPINQSGLSELNRANQLIQEYCSYDNLTINTMVSSAILNQKLQQSGIFNVSAKIVIKGERVYPDTNQTQKLSAQPQINTIRQYDGNGDMVAFDSDGLYRQISGNVGEFVPEFVSGVGDFFFASKAGQSYLLDKETSRAIAAEATSILVDTKGAPINGKFFEFYEDYIPFLKKSSSGYSVLRYANSTIFEKGDTSIFNRVSTIRPVGTEVNIVTVDSSGKQFSVVTSGTCAIVNSQLYLAVDFGSGDSHDYKIAQFGYYTGSVDQWKIIRTVSVNGSSDIRTTKFSVIDKVLIIPTKFSGQTWTDYDYFDTRSSVQSSGKVSMNTPVPLDIRSIVFSGGYLYALSAVNLYQFGYRFLSSYNGIQLFVQTNKSLSGSVPSKILRVLSSGILMLCSSSSIWRNTVFENLSEARISDARIFESDGSVDYEEDVIYGIRVFSESDVLDYQVAGTLVGSTVYPHFVENE